MSEDTGLLDRYEALNSRPKEGDYKVAYIPQVPMQPFEQRTATLEEAVLLLTTIVRFSSFEYANRIKPDYSDMASIERFEDGEWCDVDSDEYDAIMDNLFDMLEAL